jgi:hypothetical protein
MFPDRSTATVGARRYSFLTSPTNKLIILNGTIAHGALKSGNPGPEFHGPESGPHMKNGPNVHTGTSHRERRMNNLKAQGGSKSFSLNILPVSSLKSIF